MNSRKPKQDVEYLIEWETTPQLQLVEAVPARKASAVAPRPQWEAKSELVFDLGGNRPRSLLH
jgi:hypothetical protein